MGNSLRCCLACVLPCGALDLIRIVHLNGYVEEISRAVTAGEILKDYPNHVLSKPCSQGMVRKILILSPDTDLKRGSIYFLIPHSSLPSHHHHHHRRHHHHPLSTSSSTATKICKTHKLDHDNDDHKPKDVDTSMGLAALNHDQNNVMTVGVKPKPKSGRHQRRRSSRGKSGVWQPHLQCITED